MKLLVVAATKAELSKVFEHFSLPNENFIQQDKFDLLITGVGMTATAFALGRHLNSSYDLVLNVGIAGSFDKNIPLGSLVNINTDTFAELGAENHDDFIAIDDLGFGKNTFNASYQLIDLPMAKGITVNKVHGNAESIAKIEQKFNPQTESMEGAAVFYACNSLQIPCAQIRSISNYVEPRNRENWQIGLAIKNLNNWLMDFISKQTK
ncbi:futalosine hydrolase [Pedobacter boryungensis]|uniref:Futalosine hydrolase n=1 Tax=Pedobacter boryungensis TaxID=869962 RepID=A0ABX2DFM2_9SPHI|nr:futalosine hydrolase [Pedobacter boryungensis]NQX32893.1 futalosine hydrolase [Pedobacter boryungensis]